MNKTSHLHTSLILTAIFVLSCSAALMAQNREKFVISAKAGGINAVTGQASVHAKGESDWQQLMVTDDLESGDRVRTASDGRVEILLNPGSYLRIGGNSELEFADNSLANLEVRLLRGTAIVEASGADGTELMINISTPHAKLAIVRQGLYRLNVVPGDATELIVRKGRVIFGESHTKVKGGNKVVFSAVSTAVAKLTKEEKKKSPEEIEVWSKDRAETLAKANRRITNRMLTSAFASFQNPNSLWFGFRNPGFWFYNSGAGCYTFLPLFYGWGSPYGSSYHTSIYGPFGNTGGSYNGVTPTYPGSSAGSGNSGGTGYPGSSGSGSTGGTPRTPPASSPEIGNRATRKLETMTDPNRP